MRRAIIASLAVACTATGAYAFVNPGFETGDFTGWTMTPTANGRTAIQDVIDYDIDGGGPLGVSKGGRFSVGQVVFTSGVQEGIDLTQSLNLVSGETYTISFNWSAYRVSGAANSQGGVFSVVVNGTLYGTQAAGSTGATTPKYGFVNVNYTATSTGPHTIGARITRPFTVPADLYQVVDNFAIVPEPGTMIALGAGLAAMAARRRRK
jgi:hypothetical protein